MLIAYRCMSSFDVGLRCLHVLWDEAILLCPLSLFEPLPIQMTYLLHLRSPQQGQRPPLRHGGRLKPTEQVFTIHFTYTLGRLALVSSYRSLQCTRSTFYSDTD